MKKIITFIFIIMLGFMMNSCNTNDNGKTGYPYTIRMTDTPNPSFDGVFIDLQGIEITGGDGQTVSLSINKGTYNLLDLSNGTSTLIASDILEVSKVEQIRLILGPKNSVLIDNNNYPLSTPSADQSGLKLQLHQTLQQGVLYNVLLDFDANKSIVVTGNGEYTLKPVIRTIETAISGAIKGKVSPLGTQSAIEAKTGTNSYSTIVNTTGDFLIMGLPEGTYEVTITPSMAFQPATISNIAVTKGTTMNIGTTTL
jgi:hypothetical protein